MENIFRLLYLSLSQFNEAEEGPTESEKQIAQAENELRKSLSEEQNLLLRQLTEQLSERGYEETQKAFELGCRFVAKLFNELFDDRLS